MNKEDKKTKKEWAFEPTFEIEPILTEEEIKDILTILAIPPSQTPSDQEKET